ncbi:YbaB/EbfC family nucleoid-associated protein [Elusimicrobiota bacterium]
MDIMKMMKQAQKLKKLQKEMEKKTVSDEISGASLSLNGAGSVKEFKISQELVNSGKDNIETAVKNVIDSCLKKHLDLQKDMAKDAMGGMDLSKFLG